MKNTHGDDPPRRLHLCGHELPARGHICAFFDSNAQKYAAIAPYLREAIDAGDRVINVVEEAGMKQHVASLEAHEVPVTRAVEADQLHLASAEETYFRDGAPALDAVLDMLREALETANREGRSVRTCGEMNWISRDPSTTAKAMAYEAKVNDLLDRGDCTLVCVYDTNETRASIVADVLATHEYSLINGQLRRNPCYVDPKDYLAMLEGRRT